MRVRRTGAGIALLLILGGIGGFVLGHEAARPSMARADEAVKPAKADNAEQAPARKPQRFGSMIGLRPEKKDEYLRLHAHCWPEILAMIKKCHIQNYSIYMGEVDGKLYLFSYLEYAGDDIAKDMAVMKADAKTREWWSHTDPCQIRLPDTKEGDWWKSIPEVFHAD